jgi:Lar family restriction alleviation protein
MLGSRMSAKALILGPAPRPCPFCRSDRVELRRLPALGVQDEPVDLFAVHCKTCGARGPDGEARSEAIALWNGPDRMA